MTHLRLAMLRRTAHIAFDQPRVAMWTLLSVTCAFAVLGAALLVRDGTARLGVQGASSGSMVIYLGDGIGETVGQQLAAQLGAMPGVVHATLVPARESATRLAEALSADPALLQGIDLLGLPASIEVGLSRGAREVIELSPTMQALRDTPGVVDVVVESDDRDGNAAAVDRWREIGEGVAIAIAALSLVMAIGVMRVWLQRDRDADRVFHLLGASPGFAWGPTVLAGTLLGGAAATAAAIVLAVGIEWYGPIIASVLAPSGTVQLGFPSAIAVVSCIGVGLAAGTLSGWLAGDSGGAA